jgi:hypothetical protein
MNSYILSLQGFKTLVGIINYLNFFLRIKTNGIAKKASSDDIL